jgi:hypothetical protein
MTLYAFDGTWQEEGEEAGSATATSCASPKPMMGTVCSYQGIGTRGGKLLRWFGGGTGFGASSGSTTPRMTSSNS